MSPYARRNVDGVATLDAPRAEPSATCAECRWSREGATGSAWPAIRAAARRHVRATGHPVLAGVRTSYLYGRDRRPA